MRVLALYESVSFIYGRSCCSSCTSLALHRSWVREVFWFQVTASICKDWALSQNRAMLRITSRGRSRHTRGCVDWLQTAAVYTKQTTDWACDERAESLIPLTYLLVEPCGQACSAVLRHALHKTGIGLDWVDGPEALPRLSPPKA